MTHTDWQSLVALKRLNGTLYSLWLVRHSPASRAEIKNAIRQYRKAQAL